MRSRLAIGLLVVGCAGAPLAAHVAVPVRAQVAAASEVRAPESPIEPAPAPVAVAEETTFFAVPQDGHHGSVWASAWSPDGQLLATGGFDHTVRLWDREGRLWIVLRGHEEAIRRVAFRPDGEELASASRDGTVRLWDLRTGRERARIDDAADVAYAPDGRSFATVGPGASLRTWRTEDAARIAEAAAPGVAQLAGVAWIADGRTIAASAQGRIVFFDATGLAPLAEAPSGGFFAAAPHEPTVWVGGDDARLTVLDPRTGAPLRTLDVVGATHFHHLAFSRDGRWLAASGSYERTALIDPRTGRVRTRIPHARFTETLAFHPSGELLSIAGGDTAQIDLWRVPSGRLERRFGDASREVSFVAFSPDGTRLATAGDDHAEIWDLATGALLGGHEVGRRSRGRLDPTMTHATWSPDGERLAAAGGAEGAWILDGATGALVDAIPIENPDDALVELAWDASSHYLAIACGGELWRWDRASGHVLRAAATPPAPATGVFALAGRDRVAVRELPGLALRRELAPADFGARFQLARTALGPGEALAAIGDGGTLGFVSALGREPALDRGASGLGPLVFAPDGRLAYAGLDGSVRVRDGAGARVVGRHEAGVRSAAWLADGTLATGADDGTVRVWDPGGRGAVRLHALHEHRVWSVAAHPTRPLVASASSRAWLLDEDGHAIGVRAFRFGGALVGLYFDRRGAYGGDPAALARFLRIRSGPGVLGETLTAADPSGASPFPR